MNAGGATASCGAGAACASRRTARAPVPPAAQLVQQTQQQRAERQAERHAQGLRRVAATRADSQRCPPTPARGSPAVLFPRRTHTRTWRLPKHTSPQLSPVLEAVRRLAPAHNLYIVVHIRGVGVVAGHAVVVACGEGPVRLTELTELTEGSTSPLQGGCRAGGCWWQAGTGQALVSHFISS